MDGPTRKQLMQVGFAFVYLSGLSHTFSKERKLAGKELVTDFCKRLGYFLLHSNTG
jgi:hypothetical protein